MLSSESADTAVNRAEFASLSIGSADISFIPPVSLSIPNTLHFTLFFVVDNVYVCVIFTVAFPSGSFPYTPLSALVTFAVPLVGFL